MVCPPLLTRSPKGNTSVRNAKFISPHSSAVAFPTTLQVEDLQGIIASNTIGRYMDMDIFLVEKDIFSQFCNAWNIGFPTWDILPLMSLWINVPPGLLYYIWSWQPFGDGTAPPFVEALKIHSVLTWKKRLRTQGCFLTWNPSLPHHFSNQEYSFIHLMCMATYLCKWFVNWINHYQEFKRSCFLPQSSSFKAPSCKLPWHFSECSVEANTESCRKDYTFAIFKLIVFHTITQNDKKD